MQKITILIAFLLLTTTATFAQLNTTLLGQLPYEEGLNDIWGYEDEQGREYAIVGTDFGTSIVDVTIPEEPTEVFKIPGNYSFWRDIKTWQHYAYVVDDQAGEGLVIIDLSELPDNVTYEYWDGNPDVDLQTAHNLYIDENGFIYIFGAFGIGVGGAMILDASQTPENPTIAGYYDERYIHDGFVRGDTMWAAEINDGRMSIIDVSDKEAPVVLGFTFTPNFFTHNCWLSDDGQTVFTTDEVGGAYLAAYNVSDVTDIKELDRIQSNPGSNSAPHNTFVKGNFLFTSYYRDGLTIHDITYPNNMIEMGNYDTSPLEGDGFNGAWGTYPYLSSGNILVSDMEEGLFIISANLFQASYLSGTVTDADTGLPINDAKIVIDGTEATAATLFDGTYNTGWAEAGFYNITFTKPGYEPFTATDILLANGFEQTADAALIPLPSFELTGQVVDEAGNGIAFATVNVKNEDFDFDIQAFSDGNFSIPVFYEGNYDITAGAWGYRNTSINGEEIPFEADPIEVELERGIYDDFTVDLGWTTAGTSATGGEWVRVTPLGTSIADFFLNPETDVETDEGDKCYVTGNTELFDFVNTGTVSLTSPIFDLSNYGDPYISYHYWFVNIGQFSTGNDSLVVRLSNGFQEVVIETISGEGATTEEWAFSNLKVSDYISPTSFMQITFDAIADASDFQALEAGIDVFQVVDSMDVVGIDDAGIENATPVVTAYPNPFTDQTTIYIQNFEAANHQNDLHFTLFDLTGRKVSDMVVTNKHFSVLREQLPSGIYFYTLLSGKNVFGSGKLVVRD